VSGPLLLTVIVAAVACFFAWGASLATGDTSWVDRSWSIVPIIYLWIFASYAGLENVRLDVMAVLVTLWGVRLTFNFARKGGYRGVEDYRWAVLRARMQPSQFQLFNAGFIVLYQNAILVLITLPAYSAYVHRARTPFGALDVVLTALFFFCTVMETVADEQQWRFQSEKHARLERGEQVGEQFLTTGLFRYSRHPNYFFEVAQWWLLFLFGAVAANSLWQWTVIGAVLLTLLFVGSTSFTEDITLSKYPEYADYQRRTSAVIPWFAASEPAPRSLPTP